MIFDGSGSEYVAELGTGMTLHVYTIRSLVSMCAKMSHGLQITLNGDRFVVPGVPGVPGVPESVSGIAESLTVSELLTRLDIDARRVAVEHNLIVLKRAAFADTLVRDGDQVEIVNFVGGG